MKSILAGVCLISGCGLMISSVFVGNAVDADQEWTNEQQAEYARVAASAHSPGRDRQATQNRARLRVLQEQLLDLKRQAEAKKFWTRTAGIAVSVMGVGFGIWARLQANGS
ncbi:MAG: hypothetical protein AAGF97_06880 [Planctomycetota bacterium]